MLHHATGHIRNRRARTLPGELLIPISAMRGGDFHLTLMPIRFGIDQRAVHIPKHGLDHQVRLGHDVPSLRPSDAEHRISGQHRPSRLPLPFQQSGKTAAFASRGKTADNKQAYKRGKRKAPGRSSIRALPISTQYFAPTYSQNHPIFFSRIIGNPHRYNP